MACSARAGELIFPSAIAPIRPPASASSCPHLVAALPLPRYKASCSTSLSLLSFCCPGCSRILFCLPLAMISVLNRGLLEPQSACERVCALACAGATNESAMTGTSSSCRSTTQQHQRGRLGGQAQRPPHKMFANARPPVASNGLRCPYGALGLARRYPVGNGEAVTKLAAKSGQ
eukprot:3172896-Pleurochrysis_carterae.AAC.1